MFFDHNTGKTTGKLHRYTKEEIEAMDKDVRDGKAVSTKHPEDDIDVFKNRDVESEIRKAEALAAKNGMEERTDEIENMLKAMALYTSSAYNAAREYSRLFLQRS